MPAAIPVLLGNTATAMTTDSAKITPIVLLDTTKRLLEAPPLTESVLLMCARVWVAQPQLERIVRSTMASSARRMAVTLGTVLMQVQANVLQVQNMR